MFRSQSRYSVSVNEWAVTRSLYCQESFYRSRKSIASPSFDLHRSVAIVRVGQLAALGKAVDLLTHGFRKLFETADTTKPVTRRRRSVPTNRRAPRQNPLA